MTIAEKWLYDLPQQFQGKKRIEALIRAFARQMEDVRKALEESNALTDLDTARGVNLDYVGTIIPLTRKEAGELTGIGDTDPVMEDERYRQYLRYQLLRNTNECTYYDLMKGIELLWGIKPVYYREDPALPATIILTMPFLKPGGDAAVLLGEVPLLKPAGVGLTFLYFIRIAVETSWSLLSCVYDIPRCGTLVCGTYPHRATFGLGTAAITETGAGVTVTAYGETLAGTIRIGGKAWDATLGYTDSIHVFLVPNAAASVLALIPSGSIPAGTKPQAVSFGLLSSADSVVEGCRQDGMFHAASAGTVRIGGKTYEAYLGSLENGHGVESSMTGNIMPADSVRTGAGNAGTIPENRLKAAFITAGNVKNTETAVTNAYILPAAGRQTAGGGALADAAYAAVAPVMEMEALTAAMLPSQPAAASARCGSGTKAAAWETDGIETGTGLETAAAAIRRCGQKTARCGRK